MSELLDVSRGEVYNRVTRLEDRLDGTYTSGVITLKGTYVDVDLDVVDKKNIGYKDRAYIKNKQGEIVDKLDCPTIAFMYDLMDRAKQVEYFKLKGVQSDLLDTLVIDFDNKVVRVKEKIKKGSRVDVIVLKGVYCTMEVKVDLNSRSDRYRLIVREGNNIVLNEYIALKVDLLRAYKRVRNIEISNLLKNN